MRKVFLLAILAALLLAACDGVTITDAQIGPTQTEAISVPAPDSDAAELTLRFGAADRFKLQPGAAGLVEGTIQYNAEQLKPAVSTSGGRVTIEQKSNNVTLSTKLRNEWDLKLSDAIPLDLTVEAGAYKGAYDLGGLRLRELNVEQGAADATYDFGAPNREVMRQLTLKSGASNLQATNLANANADSMYFETAAGNYTLDFGGTLARTANVEVHSAASNLTIRVPSDTPMLVRITSGLNGADLTNFREIGDKQYANAVWDDSQPHIVVTIDSAVGAVHLESR
jgi:hypothetical protein